MVAVGTVGGGVSISIMSIRRRVVCAGIVADGKHADDDAYSYNEDSEGIHAFDEDEDFIKFTPI